MHLNRVRETAKQKPKSCAKQSQQTDPGRSHSPALTEQPPPLMSEGKAERETLLQHGMRYALASGC